MRNNAAITPARIIIEQFGRAQKKNVVTFPCPRCGHDTMDGVLTMNALSRRANVYICSRCGTDEAMYDFARANDDIENWSIVKAVRK